MSEVNLGQIRRKEDDFRDAIHVAVAPVVAGEDLMPGDHVGLINVGDRKTVGKSSKKHIGVIDPFVRVKSPIKKGTQLWIMLYPNTITSLRHEWFHPDFEHHSPDSVSESRDWLVWFANEIGLDYDDVLQACRDYVDGGEYYMFYDLDTPDAAHRHREEMWKHFQVVTGIDPGSDKCAPFSCSC